MAGSEFLKLSQSFMKVRGMPLLVVVFDYCDFIMIYEIKDL